ncbi:MULTISPECIES: carboxylate-amine ligase [unclassified Pseudomonas]|uniref:carboxylate-amine ligase n=1 Tax=unclassified Pseudomonas TaxID=196821 RepID=UPI000C880A54|nr:MULTISPECIES: carboxylate-amine ligase [unclassified Pseudomonas]PMZ88296.1 carboxylate-amine ligase [Pseudomonas sp. FW305-42]PNA24885.1 carboxylate-amine ligase [Pseudomonas sp. MPR-R1B]PNB21754.1 carboxylate-amine ligase [Pseudomonas sp. DP16D-E2]PNB41166.1 carboxylate-amine ligase [Pseudomonas sp. FW305-17]PNB56779.1 carboxylate-amine ligase [Pseudomonas sp. GW531-E2]
MGRPCTFGIEEEYLLVALDSGRVLSSPSTALIRLCREVLGPCFAEEMFRSQIELASPVFETLHQARAFFTEHRQRLSQALAAEGVGLYCAASHPSAQWLRQHPRATPHFRQLFDAYRLVARRSLLNGLHVHVGVPPGLDRMQVINRVLYWLPLLLSLSTSSPYWCGQDTGYMSYRRVVCGEWPHMGLPEPLPDWSAYERYRALLQRSGTLAEDGDFWWAIRPSMRFPTVELRICDGCPRLEDGLAIAGLFRHLVEQAIARHDSMPLSREMRWITQENYWRAMHHGRLGTFIGLVEQQPVSAEGWLAQLQGQCPADSADAERAFMQAWRILREGTSADRQRSWLAQANELVSERRKAMQWVASQVVREASANGAFG